MIDAANTDRAVADWWDTMIKTYESEMIAIISVNCTTINMEFNPNDP
jgi:hypothetical protein